MRRFALVLAVCSCLLAGNGLRRHGDGALTISLRTRNGPPISQLYAAGMRFLVAATGLLTVLALLAPVH